MLDIVASTRMLPEALRRFDLLLRAVAERGQDQRPVGDGLRGRQPDAGADRPIGGGGRPGPVLVVIRVHMVERIVQAPAGREECLAAPDSGYESPIQA